MTGGQVWCISHHHSWNVKSGKSSIWTVGENWDTMRKCQRSKNGPGWESSAPACDSDAPDMVFFSEYGCRELFPLLLGVFKLLNSEMSLDGWMEFKGFKLFLGKPQKGRISSKKQTNFPRAQLKKRMCSDIFQGLEPFSSLTFCRLLVGAPYEMNGPHQTGDVYKCSINRRNNGCSKLNLGRVSQHAAGPITHTTLCGDGNQDAH